MGERRREDLEELVFERVAVVHHGEDVVVAELDEDEDDATHHVVVAALHRLLGEGLHLRDARDHDVNDRLVLWDQVVPVKHLVQRAAAHLEEVRGVNGLRVSVASGRYLEERGQDARGGQLFCGEAVERHPRLEAGEHHLLRVVW